MLSLFERRRRHWQLQQQMPVPDLGGTPLATQFAGVNNSRASALTDHMDGLGAMSWAGWITPSAVGPGQQMIWVLSNEMADVYGCFARLTDRIEFAIQNSVGAKYIHARTVDAVAAARMHVALTWRRINDDATDFAIYVNAVAVPIQISASGNPENITTQATRLYYGVDGRGAGEPPVIDTPYGGLIDGVARFWGRQLTAGEVAAEYAGNPVEGSVHAHNFGGADASLISDQTGNADLIGTGLQIVEL